MRRTGVLLRHPHMRGQRHGPSTTLEGWFGRSKLGNLQRRQAHRWAPGRGAAWQRGAPLASAPRFRRTRASSRGARAR
jgi:hypothetical protein